MRPKNVERVIDSIAKFWVLDTAAEITLEANPDGFADGVMRDFRSAGINRLSLGVQALDAGALSFLGRTHTVEQAQKTAQRAREIFPNLNIDAIYGRPNHSVSQWEEEIRALCALDSDHLSLYGLTVEPATRFFGALKRKEWRLPAQNHAARLFHACREQTFLHGYHHYEVSSYARPGRQSAHNCAVWKYQDSLGIGPGACARYTRGGRYSAIRHASNPEKWLERVLKQGETGEDAIEILSEHTQSIERLLTGLRLVEGLPYSPENLPVHRERLAQLIASGDMWQARGRIGVEPKAMAKLDAILVSLIRFSDAPEDDTRA